MQKFNDTDASPPPPPAPRLRLAPGHLKRIPSKSQHNEQALGLDATQPSTPPPAYSVQLPSRTAMLTCRPMDPPLHQPNSWQHAAWKAVPPPLPSITGGRKLAKRALPKRPQGDETSSDHYFPI